MGNNLTDVRAVSAYALAIAGLLIWVLQTYVFHGDVPGPVATAIAALVPAAVGYVATHVALNKTPPRLAAVSKLNVRAHTDPPTGGKAA